MGTTTELCNRVTTSEPFDLEPEGNSTHAEEDHITAEDRELSYLVSNVTTEAHSCETGRVIATVYASCAVAVVQPS